MDRISSFIKVGLAIAITYLSISHISRRSYDESTKVKSDSSRHLVQMIDDECKDIEPQEDFNIEDYVREPWFVQKQRVVNYLPRENFYCTEARYSLDPPIYARLFGWQVSVNNYDETVEGYDSDDSRDTGTGLLCARLVNPFGEYKSKLGVSPCFLFPSFFWASIGPYWVMAFDDDAGWAVITGGRPSIYTEGKGCANKENEGFWIFTRERNGTIAENNTAIALEAVREKGLNVDDLDDFFEVDQSNCNRPELSEA